MIATAAIIRAIVIRTGEIRIARASDCQLRVLIHPFQVPPSSRARLSAPTIDHRFHYFW
jgi:hypothetical protein